MHIIQIIFQKENFLFLEDCENYEISYYSSSLFDEKSGLFKLPSNELKGF